GPPRAESRRSGSAACPLSCRRSIAGVDGLVRLGQAAMTDQSRGPEPQGLFRRWRRWIIAAAVLLVVRAALPPVLRHVLASQASKALHTRVDIGDVDLFLLRGGVALKDVAVYAPTAQPGPDGGPPGEPPLISWKRFGVGIRYLPLFRKAVRLREVVLEGPPVALHRLPAPPP